MICKECENEFDDNPGKAICKTCEDWAVEPIDRRELAHMIADDDPIADRFRGPV